jgi:hypothetical protein
MFQHRKTLTQLQTVFILFFVVMTGVSLLGLIPSIHTASVTSGSEVYVVTQGGTTDKLSTITPEGTRTIIYTFTPKTGLYDLCVDSSGNYIVAEGSTSILSKVTPSGERTVIYKFSPGTYPDTPVIDSSGNYIIAEYYGVLSKVTPAGERSVVHTFLDKKYGFPIPLYSLEIDSSGNYVVSEGRDDKLVKSTPTGIETVIYNFTAGSTPNAFAIDSSGNYIVPEQGADILSKVTPAGVRSVIYNFAKGTSPIGLVIDSSGNYIVAEIGSKVLSKVTPSGERTVIYRFQYDGPIGVAVVGPPRVGDLKVTAKDSFGAVISGASVLSSSQPGGQSALSGTSVADGSVTFIGLAIGDYTLQVTKSGYIPSSANGAVKAGVQTELSVTLQSQPSSGIPSYPISSIIAGVLSSAALLWMNRRKPSSRGA